MLYFYLFLLSNIFYKVCLLRLIEGRGLLYDFVCRDIMLFGCVKSKKYNNFINVGKPVTPSN